MNLERLAHLAQAADGRAPKFELGQQRPLGGMPKSLTLSAASRARWAMSLRTRVLATRCRYEQRTAVEYEQTNAQRLLALRGQSQMSVSISQVPVILAKFPPSGVASPFATIRAGDHGGVGWRPCCAPFLASPLASIIAGGAPVFAYVSSSSGLTRGSARRAQAEAELFHTPCESPRGGRENRHRRPSSIRPAPRTSTRSSSPSAKTTRFGLARA